MSKEKTSKEERPAAPAASGIRGFEGDPEHKARVAAIKAAAKRTPDGKSAMYVVGPQGHYRMGRLYGPGEVVTIPLDQDPSVTFEPVRDDRPAARDVSDA